MIENVYSGLNYVYLLRCRDGSLYCGWTTNLEKRLAKHNRGQGAKYTRSRLPVALVYFEEYADRHKALVRERQIKGMRRDAKVSLIRNSPAGDPGPNGEE